MRELVKIKNKKLKYPIIQGGMGVGVSLSGLATAVINEGCVGTISAAQPGFEDPDFYKSGRTSYIANEKALIHHIQKVRENTPADGFLAVNILSVTADYAHIAKVAVSQKVDAIISGAGLPIDLPAYTKGSDTANIPIISNSRVLHVICKKWMKKFEVLPDAVIVEGPEAGGHLGVKYEELNSGIVETDLEARLADVLAYRELHGHTYPIFVAGGVYTHEDIARYVSLGADGVQMGTRFIATNECDAHENFKNVFVNAKKEDIRYVKSPVGYPARAFTNGFTEKLDIAHIPVEKCYVCVTPCDGKVAATPYCITDYLIKAVQGDIKNGLVFTGANGYRVEKIVSVKELITELKGDLWQE
jgi:nitronate monooxygenase